MITLIAFLCAVAAFVIAILNGLGKGRPPLWLAVALLAFAAMLPWAMSRLIF